MLGAFSASPLASGTQSKASRPVSNTGATASTNSKNDVLYTHSIVPQTALSLEYASLRHQNHCPLGMYVVPSPDSLFVWDAVLFVHQGECTINLIVHSTTETQLSAHDHCDQDTMPVLSSGFV